VATPRESMEISNDRYIRLSIAGHPQRVANGSERSFGIVFGRKRRKARNSGNSGTPPRFHGNPWKTRICKQPSGLPYNARDQKRAGNTVRELAARLRSQAASTTSTGKRLAPIIVHGLCNSTGSLRETAIRR
jgi:hypothetical protein